jgi:predicted Zn-dependent protease
MELHAQDPADTDLLFMIASEHATEGRPAEAITWLTRYVESGRDVGAGWALLADCHEELGDTPALRSALERGIEAALRGGHPSLAGVLRARLDET